MEQIIINKGPYDTRIAIKENDQLVELIIEGRKHKRLVGSVIKGRVTKVLPGMQAAFIDIGLSKDAFLYVEDFIEPLDDLSEMIIDGEEDELERGNEHRERIYAKPDDLHIEDLLQRGQQVLVQISKEPLGSKGARVTSYINLPGRFLVYMPTVKHVGVSRRIIDEGERARLKSIIEELSNESEGFIVRTVGEGKGKEDFEADMRMLKKVWAKIQQKAENIEAPAFIHTDLDPIYRAIRDFLTSETEAILLDSEDDYEKCLEMVNEYMPDKTSKVKLFTKNIPIFEEYGIEQQIEKALGKKVWLKSGGYLVIEQTEALTSIDVNTGKFVGKDDLEDTITKTNMDAAREIARQIRLRNLGGIIVIDFIDMLLKENRQKVLEVLEEEMSKDHARSYIYNFTALGLVEITRKRVRKSLDKLLCTPCPYCDGCGQIKDVSTVCYEIYRELYKMLYRNPVKEVTLRVHPKVALALRNEEQRVILDIQDLFATRVNIYSDDNLHHHTYNILIG